MKKLCLFGMAVIVSLICVHTAKELYADDSFLKTLQDSLHKLGDPWIAGSTSVSHLSWGEKQKLCGCKVPTPEEFANDPVLRAHDMTGKLPKRKNLPPEFLDWRNVDGHDWMTQPKKQGLCGSCWAFAICGALEARLKIANDWPDDRNYPDLSEQFLVSCDTRNYGCAMGRMDWAAEFVVNTGVPDEACFQYTSGTTGNSGNCLDRCPDWEERVVKPKDWGTVNGVSQLKELVMEGPIGVSVIAKEDFFYYKGGVYKPIMGKNMGPHGVVLCGWRNADNAWLIKNSFGIHEDQFVWYEVPPNTYAAWNILEQVAWVRLDNYEINEPNDDVWNSGESIDIITTLKSKGQTFANVVGVLSTSDSFVTITNNTFNFGSISDGHSANNSATPYKVTAKPDAPESYDVTFTLQVTADGYSRELTFTGTIGYKAEFDFPGPYLYGMAFDGTYLWATDADGIIIIKIDPTSGNIVGEIPAPGGIKCSGIAWDGVNNVLWVHNFNTKQIYEVDTSDGSVLNSFASPAGYPTGLAFDGEHLWAVDRDGYKIYKVTTSGDKIDEFPILVLPEPLFGPRGLAFEPAGPNGGSLLLFMTHFRWDGERRVLDSTVVWEMSKNSLLTGKHVVTPLTNGRAVEVHPGTGKYWVNTLVPPKIYRIDGLYEAGTEEQLRETRILSLTISPNPSQRKTSIGFSVPNAGKVKLNIYDIAGKLVCRLVDNKVFKAGNHKITWNGKDNLGKEISRGIYFCQLTTDKSIRTKKFVLIR